MKRFITIDSEKRVGNLRYGKEIVEGEIESVDGKPGQRQLSDGSFEDIPITLGENQHQMYGKTHESVDSGIITAEVFKQITNEEYIPHIIK